MLELNLGGNFFSRLFSKALFGFTECTDFPVPDPNPDQTTTLGKGIQRTKDRNQNQLFHSKSRKVTNDKGKSLSLMPATRNNYPRYKSNGWRTIYPKCFPIHDSGSRRLFLIQLVSNKTCTGEGEPESLILILLILM